jgi:hypothetical protein
VVPSGAVVPRACGKPTRHGAQSSVEHEAAFMLGCSPSLSLFLLILAGFGRSASASRASSMRAAGVCCQAWPIAASPDGSGRDDFPPQACTVSGPSGRGTGKLHARALRGKAGHRAGSRREASKRIASAERPDARCPEIYNLDWMQKLRKA